VHSAFKKSMVYTQDYGRFCTMPTCSMRPEPGKELCYFEKLSGPSAVPCCPPKYIRVADGEYDGVEYDLEGWK